MRRDRRPRPAVAAALLAIGAAADPPPRYTAAQLHCAEFRETARSRVRTEIGGRVREETTGRDGRWRFRAHPSPAGVRLEGWYDSLAVWRETREARLAPETDGVIGGRYRGVLTPTGGYAAEARPFVPGEVAEVADVASALDDLFPPLPPVPLRPGQRWTDSLGLEIERLPDSAAARRRLGRFRLGVRREADRLPLPGDTAGLEARQVTAEEGRFVWDTAAGLVRRERRIAVETVIPEGARVRRRVRSRLEQEVVLARVPGSGCEAAARPR